MKICDNCKEEIKGALVPGDYWATSKASGFALCKACYDATERDGELPIVFNKAEHDPVNHPKHYTNHPSGIECIQITRHMNNNRGNAMKYIWRCGDKGKPIQDLRKAIFYLEDEIKRLQEFEGIKE